MSRERSSDAPQDVNARLAAISTIDTQTGERFDATARRSDANPSGMCGTVLELGRCVLPKGHEPEWVHLSGRPITPEPAPLGSDEDEKLLHSILYYCEMWEDGEDAAHSLGHIRQLLRRPDASEVDHFTRMERRGLWPAPDKDSEGGTGHEVNEPSEGAVAVVAPPAPGQSRDLYVAFETVTGEACFVGDSHLDIEKAIDRDRKRYEGDERGYPYEYEIVGPWNRRERAKP